MLLKILWMVRRKLSLGVPAQRVYTLLNLFKEVIIIGASLLLTSLSSHRPAKCVVKVSWYYLTGTKINIYAATKDTCHLFFPLWLDLVGFRRFPLNLWIRITWLESDVSIIFVLQKDLNEREDSFLRYFLLSFSGPQEFHLKAVFTSLNVAFVPLSRLVWSNVISLQWEHVSMFCGFV